MLTCWSDDRILTNGKSVASFVFWLYRILFLPTLLLLSPYYLRRMKRRGGYRTNFPNRFGRYRPLPAKRADRPRVWLQAVSVGEVLAIEPILEALKQDGVEVFLTTTTSTGYRLAKERYAERVLGIGYFPLDWWLFSRRAWRAVDPDLAVLTEGERWPEHMRRARRRGVPVVCINARISKRSFRRIMFFRPAAGLMLRDISLLLPCSGEDQKRFLALGFPAQKMRFTGNIKLDVEIQPLDEAAVSSLRRELGLPAGWVLLGSSTWPGEEEALIQALAEARAAGLNCSLLIVPRHADRRKEIEPLLRESPWRFHFRSDGAASGEVDVAVADTTGELRRLTQLADVVFVGKSLPPHNEGQTPVEAAALGKPILFGPGMGNFQSVARDLLARGAAQSVADARALAHAARGLLQDPARRESMAAAAAAWQRENRGAAARTLDAIRGQLATRSRSQPRA
jgi:3-deoxy-D-manno-octulosonic-acid transferase